jgi:transposase
VHLLSGYNVAEALWKEGTMYYVGVDYHKTYSYLVVKDEEGKLQRRGKVVNTKAELRQFLEPYGCGRAALESTRNWGLIYDWLDEVLDEVVLAHPLKTRAIAEAKIKTDKISADILADLLRAELLPKAYVPGKQTREAKNILRQRMFFVRLQTMVKNRIHDILDRHQEVMSEAPKVSDLFGATGMKWLKGVVLTGGDNRLLASEIELLEVLRGKISESDDVIAGLAKGDKRAKLLRTIPGIGAFFSVLILYEIDDVNRFSSPDKLCSYAGLVPSTYASGGKVYHGRITKQGNKWLRWAVTEAVQPARKSDVDIYAHYQRLKVRKGSNAAKVATGRRLLTIVYRVLSQERPYVKRRIKKANGSNPGCPQPTLAGT